MKIILSLERKVFEGLYVKNGKTKVRYMIL